MRLLSAIRPSRGALTCALQAWGVTRGHAAGASSTEASTPPESLVVAEIFLTTGTANLRQNREISVLPRCGVATEISVNSPEWTSSVRSRGSITAEAIPVKRY